MSAAVLGKALIEQISRQAIPASAVGVWWLGQSSLVLKTDALTIYVDPYLQVADRRLMPPAFAPDAVTNADLVLLTHDHLDHIDPNTLPGLAMASPNARFVAPRPVVERVAELVGANERVVPAVADTPLTEQGIAIIPIPAKHEEFDEDPTLGYPYLGYVLRLPGVTIYNAGDTIPYAGLVERLQPLAIDLAFIPINGRDYFRTSIGILGNCDYREAVELALAIGVDTVVPVHYGMFAGNTVPPGYFATYLAQRAPQIAAHYLAQYRGFLYQPLR